MVNLHLKTLYRRENALQAINATAAEIERQANIAVIRGHLGNPLGPQFEGSNRIAAEYYIKRSQFELSRGYTDVVGPPVVRHIIANALTLINRLERGAITKDNIRGVNGGTGALNLAISIFDNPTVLVSDPYYPSWMDIAEHLGVKLETYDLREEDDYLINCSIVESRIAEITDNCDDRAIVLIYHYPNNPTGKTLSCEEAKEIAASLNHAVERWPRLYLVQEDLYLGTIAPHMGIYSPLSYVNERTRQRMMWIVSPSKIGHAQDRGSVIAAFNADLLLHLRGALSFDMLGPSHPSLLVTASTLSEIAMGGVEAKGIGESSNNFRYEVAAYYQERLKIVADGIRKIESITGHRLLSGCTPQGGYYLYPSLECLRGKPVPRKLLALFEREEAVFRNADDVASALAHAHLIGLQPVTIASGTLFTAKSETMRIRIATVETSLQMMYGIVNTIAGLLQTVLNVDLGASFAPVESLREKHPVNRNE